MQARSAPEVVETWVREICAEPARARSPDPLSLSQLLAGADEEYLVMSELMEAFCKERSLATLVHDSALGLKVVRALLRGSNVLVSPELLAQFGAVLADLMSPTPLRLCAAVLSWQFTAAVESAQPPPSALLTRLAGEHPLLAAPFLAAAVKLLLKCELLIMWTEGALDSFLLCVVEVLAAEIERRRDLVYAAAQPKRVHESTPLLEVFFALCRPIFLDRILRGEATGELEKALLLCACITKNSCTTSPLHFKIMADCICAITYLQRLPALSAKFPFLIANAHNNTSLFAKRCIALGKPKLAEQFLKDVTRATIEVDVENISLCE